MCQRRQGELKLSISQQMLRFFTIIKGTSMERIEAVRDITYHKKAEGQKRKAERDLTEARDNLEMKVKEGLQSGVQKRRNGAVCLHGFT
jgi:hypothetical protein